MISGSGNEVAPPGELFPIALGIGPSCGDFPASSSSWSRWSCPPGVVVVVTTVDPVAGGGGAPFEWAIATASARWMSSRALDRPRRPSAGG